MPLVHQATAASPLVRDGIFVIPALPAHDRWKHPQRMSLGAIKRGVFTQLKQDIGGDLAVLWRQGSAG